MKRIITTLVFLLAGISCAMAMPGSRSMLRLWLSNGRQIMVNIDGRQYNKHAPSLTIGDLPAGRHRIKVYEYRPYSDGSGGHAKLVYSSTIRIKPNTYAYGTIDVDGSTLRLFSRDLDDYYAHRSQYDHDDYGGNGSGNGNDHTNGNDGYDHTMPGGGYDDNDHGNDYGNDHHNGNEHNGNDQGYNNRNVLSGNDMDDLRTRVNDRITDTDKEKLVKSVLDSRNCTTDQVRTMMGWFSFDSTKLDFAKWAYSKVVDSRNYWKLESEFSFSSSKDEFNNYINGK